MDSELIGVRLLRAALDARDRYTGTHSEVAVSLAVSVARRLKLGCEEIAGTTGPPADLTTQLCAPLTFAAQCELLGVPEHHRDRLRVWSVASSGQPDAAPELARLAEVELHRGVGEVLGELRRARGRALFDRLLDACDRSALIDEQELHGIAASMFRDGHFLAATQIANCMVYLLEHPQLLALLRQRPTLLKSATADLAVPHPDPSEHSAGRFDAR
jgi:cytochrome P450